MTLSCGGKGPCCHVGYSHRHCEHCDLVIDTRQYVAPIYPLWNQFWYQPVWSQPTYTFGAPVLSTYSVTTANALPTGD